MGDSTSSNGDAAVATALQFVQARRQARALAAFPGEIPATIEDAYLVQAAAIANWPDAIAGWKVGYIAPEMREPHGDERLVGPIFATALQPAQISQCVDFPVFAGGFAAVEAELVFRIGADAPAGQLHWTTEQAGAIASDLHVGIETAGSPLATINDLGPRVVISDFGNNAGMLLGPSIEHWRTRNAPLRCTSFVENHEVGATIVDTLAWSLNALAFALSRCARNGRPLRAGDLVTTGALTGIHDIAAGQTARVDFSGIGSIICRAVEAGAFARTRGTA